MKTVFVIALAALLDIIPSGEAFLTPLQKRDSVLIADQIEYGFELKGVQEGAGIALPDLSQLTGDTLALVRDWKIDTTAVRRKSGSVDIRVSSVLAPFEQGEYHLGDIYVLRLEDGRTDTLSFSAPESLEVWNVPLDTATFEVKDLKGQIGYPLTFKEVLPWIGGAVLLAALIAGLFLLFRKISSQRKTSAAPSDPPHVVALRTLDRYRSDKYWAPEKQKAFYSGITDAVKSYIDAVYGIDAPEMTTAELFDALKGRQGISQELYDALKDLFERADFVKFAKYIASQQQNEAALPLCVRFVTETYQESLRKEEEAKDEI